jgi:hypothetical protein
MNDDPKVKVSWSRLVVRGSGVMNSKPHYEEM